MATYCVTFRISQKTVGGKTYADRREMLMDNIRTDGMGFWDETTSFILTESNLDTSSFGVAASKGLSAGHDTIVVFDPDDMSAAYFGVLQHDGVLRSFFKSLKKVP